MSTLILRMTGPMQSWAVNSRYATREAGREPSKSGIVGLLAAALGRPREDDVSDLAQLTIGTRTDQPGRLLVDYHTARERGSKHSALSWRHYLTDAAFTVAISGEERVIETLVDAVAAPRFPLYLGRRSCPVPANFLGGSVLEDDVERVLRDFDIAPWLAADWYRKEMPTNVYLQLSRDARPGEKGDVVRDIPQSFSPSARKYDSRMVVRCEPVRVENPQGTEPDDPFFALVKES